VRNESSHSRVTHLVYAGLATLVTVAVIIRVMATIKIWV